MKNHQCNIYTFLNALIKVLTTYTLTYIRLIFLDSFFGGGDDTENVSKKIWGFNSLITRYNKKKSYYMHHLVPD